MTMMVTRVDKLEVYVVVDNYVEWISTLPPGFSHELPQHISRPPPRGPPIDELTGLPMLDFENYCCGAHGLSLLLVTTIGEEKHHVLLDTGPEGISIKCNLAALNIDLAQLDVIVLSHWHRDHSGGILEVLKLRSQCLPSTSPQRLRVNVHADRPIRRGISRPPDYEPIIALPPDPTFREIQEAGGLIETPLERHELQGKLAQGTGVWVSGEIPRVHPFEVGLPGAITWMEDENGDGGWYTDELIKDERYVVVDVKGKGLCVFSSCSHAGICNVLTDVVNKFDRPIYMVAGGLHLVPTSQQPVKQTIDFLSRRVQPPIAYALPLHCTGLEPRGMLRAALGERCVTGGVGIKAVIEGNDADEEALHATEVEILPLGS